MSKAGVKAYIARLNNNIATEANVPTRIVNVDNESMKIQLITDKIIIGNGLKQVTNPIMFERAQIPTVGGLFSEHIFGTTLEERMRAYAYVDLKMKFFHPYVFEVIKKVYRNIAKIAAGESAWHITPEGELIEIPDVDNPLYDEDNTGLSWIISNFKKVKFTENESTGRKNNLTFLKSLTDDELFITKWLVVPVFYRDVDMSTGRPSVPEINYEYNNLIKYTNMLTKDAIGFFNNKAMYNVQLTLVKMRVFSQSLIAKKQGAFHQTVLGKSIDRGCRSVISVPIMNEVNVPEDNSVDMFHSGIPLAQCLVLGYDFVIKWCEDFFRQEFDGVSKKSMYRKNPDTKEYDLVAVPIKDQLSLYTTDYIRKKMKNFINTYGGRFEPLMIQLQDGQEVYMSFTGRGMSRQKDSPLAATITNRPMTWTDLFYMAAVETLSDKHVYITRYPLTDYLGIFPTLCVPLSTVNTMPVMIGDTLYKNYPVVDMNMSQDEVSTNFIDTTEISNLFLEAIGGD